MSVLIINHIYKLLQTEAPPAALFSASLPLRPASCALNIRWITHGPASDRATDIRTDLDGSRTDQIPQLPFPSTQSKNGGRLARKRSPRRHGDTKKSRLTSSGRLSSAAEDSLRMTLAYSPTFSAGFAASAVKVFPVFPIA